MTIVSSNEGFSGYFENEYFTKDELKCPCCNELRLARFFLKNLIELRIKADFPFYVESCCRCKERNDKVGGVPHSRHRLDFGKGTHAIDLKNLQGRHKWTILELAPRYGFFGIGLNKTTIHIDRREFPKRAAWGY